MEEDWEEEDWDEEEEDWEEEDWDEEEKTGKKNEDLTFCEIVGVTGFEGRCHKLYRLQT